MENNTLCNRHSLGVNNHTKMYVTYTRIYGWSDYGGESSYQPGYRLENMMWMTLLVYDYIIPGEYFMQNEIYDEKNGLTYMLCGDYYLPELALTDIEPTYGKYGMLRKSYLQEHRKAKYQILLLQGKLVEHLNQIDAEARDREEQLVKQMMEKEGITEKLKRQDNMEWTRRMNTLCHDAEEMILTEMIYTKG